MNWDEIKKIIESEGGKFIIVENGKPILVVASFEEYKKMLQLKEKSDQRFKNLEKNYQKKSPPKELKQGLTIDDLPF